MPIHVTTSTTQSLSNKTFVDRLSTTGIVYANGGTSNQWNSAYSNLQSNSATWVSTVSALSSGDYTFVLNSDGTFSIPNGTISTGTDEVQLYSGSGAAITWYNPSGGGPGVAFLSKARATEGAVKFTFLNGAPPFLTSSEFSLSSDGTFKFPDSTIQSTAFVGTAVDTGVRAISSNWQNTYTSFSTQSAANAAVYTTVNSKSANWDSVYSSFNTQSANNASVYSTVQTNSSSWTGGGATYVPATYTRWAFTGSPPTSAFSIPGATSSETAAYRVTVDFLLQDPSSYTINNTTDVITFSEAPPLSSTIIVIEETFSQVSAGDGAKWNSTYSTVNTNSATWSAPAASSLTGTSLSSNIVGSSLTRVGVLTGLTTSGILSVGYRGSADSSLVIAGSSTKGGAGYHDFLRVTNGDSTATNPNKYFRLNSTGEMEVINSAYNAIIFTIDNSGNTTVGGNLTINGGRAGYSSARPGFRVYGSGTTNNIALTSNTDGTLNGTNFAADFNQGGHLNTSTGLFTVPYTGLYQINVVGRTAGWNGGISQLACISPTRSDKVLTFIEWAANTTMIHAGASTTAYLTAGDTLKLKVLAGQINFDTNDNWSVAYLG